MNKILPLLISFLFLPALFAEELTPPPNAEGITKLVVRSLPQRHLSHEAMSESVVRRMLDNFFRAMDFDRTIFKAEDIVTLRKAAADLESSLKDGDVTFAYEAFSLYKERARDRVAYVNSLLEDGFDLTKEETYVWRRKDAAWAASDEEWNDLWRKKVKNEYVGLLVSQKLRELEAEEAAAEAEGDEDAAEAETEEKEDEVDLSPEERIRKRYAQFIEVLEGHDAGYVLQMYLDSFAGSFDTHSSYLSPRKSEDFDIQMKLSLTGIGAVLNYDEGAAKIERLMKGGPAFKDGRLKPGDKIIAVQQEGEEPVDILYWPLYKSVRLIRGEKGTTVILHVIPSSDASGTLVRKIDIVRDEIKLEEKAARSKVHELERDDASHKLGIIALPDFYADFSVSPDSEEGRSSSLDVRRLLEKLNSEDVDGLVFDLRNNGGGSLRDCVEMTGYFIDRGPTVQVKSNRQAETLDDPNPGVLFDKPMVVLVNRLSASASEILAAALQDYGRAVIVGDSKTHGKGSVQSLLPLDRRDDSLGQLKVTTAGFFRVDGRSTQLKGVAPDIVIRTPTDVMELGEEYLPNVLPWSWVRPSGYRPWSDLREANEVLGEKSMARLEENEKFKYYQDKVDRLAERVQRREASLNFDARLAQSKKDRELDKLQDKGLLVIDEEENEAEDNEEEEFEIMPERDLVLREGLEILADLIEFQNGGPEGGEEGRAAQPGGAAPQVEELIQTLESIQ